MGADRTRRPDARTPRPLRLPEFERRTLSNGLQVEFARRTGIPEVSLRLVLEGGAAAETPEHAGLAELTARLLTEGTPGRDAIDIARWLDRLGAAHDASAGYSVGTVSMHFLSDVLEDALEFLASTVIEPDFPDREVVRVRGERLDEIVRQRDDPATVADLALIAELYDGGLYGRPVAGTEASVSAITRDHVRGFHADRYGPDGALLIVCGDVDLDQLSAAVEHRFSAWTGRSDRLDPPANPTVKGGDVILIDRPGSSQAEIRVATLGVPYGTEDHHKIIVANATLGGLFNSRINMNLREDKGWTYGARSAFRFRRGAGPFVARTAVETSVTAAAFEEMLKEIETMRTELVSEEELSLAKNALTLSLPLQFETAAQITSKVSRQRIYDLPDDYWEAYRGEIERVTVEHVRAVCQTHFDRDRLTLLAVTDAKVTRESLERFGPLNLRGPA